MRLVSLRRWALNGAALIVVLVLLLVPTLPVLANGVPVDIYLSYLPKTSNWGPQTASGKANVAVADGKCTLDVQGLPRLNGEHYAVWLQSREERKMYRIGAFNTEASGQGHLSVLLDNLPYQEYRMLLLTVERDGANETAPGDRVSLAGLFPNKVVVQVNPETTPGPQQQPQPGARPQYLPVTGAPAGAAALGPALAALTVAGTAFVAARMFARKGGSR